MGRDGTPGPPKTKAGYRVVPLVPALRRLLVAWKLRAPHTLPGDLVIGTANGGAVQERNIRRALDAAKETASLDETEVACRCTHSDTPGSRRWRRAAWPR